MHNPKGAWRMCVGACILQLCIVGLSINSFSVYMPYLLRQCGLSNSESANILLVRNCVAFVCLFFVGKIYAKLELRLGICLSFIFAASGMLLYATAQNYPQLLLGALAAGLGYGLGGMYPVSVLLHRWFRIHEPIALGICTACTGLAVIFGSPIITSISETYGVQTTLLIHGVMLMVSAAICFVIIRNWPENVEHRRVVKKERKHRFRFTWMHVAAMCIGINGNAAFQFLAMHFTDQGLNPYEVAGVISAVGTALMISKFLYGGAVDHFGARKTNVVFMVVSTAGLVLCALCGDHYSLAMVSMILFGLGLAYSTIGLTVYAGDLGSLDEFENRVREYQMFYMLGSLTFSPVVGILADVTGSYVLFYLIAAAMGVAALIIIEQNYKRKGAA